MATKIQLRRDLAANWASTNPVLAQGEPGLELDTHKIKVGDGTTSWNDLAYTVNQSGLEEMFVAIYDETSNPTQISTDGINWTYTVTGNQEQMGNDWFPYDAAIGNGKIVYITQDYNLSNGSAIRYSTTPNQNPIMPTSDITHRGPNGETLDLNEVSFGGGYFVVSGSYYDTARNDYFYPIGLYSVDGENWNKINIDLDYINTIITAQLTAHPNTTTGISLANAVYGQSGWLIGLGYTNNDTDLNDKVPTGAFYITAIDMPLNSTNYLSTIPGTQYGAYDGHGWVNWDPYGRFYFNSSPDPRQGSWRTVDFNVIATNLINNSSEIGINYIDAGPLGANNYMAISDYYGAVYYTEDQGVTWNSVTPGPAYGAVDGINATTDGSITLTWGENNNWNLEPITISGSYVPQLNGTWYMGNENGGAFPLYHDKAGTQPFDMTGLSYATVAKVATGNYRDNTLILADTTNIVVGQQVSGIEYVLTFEDYDGDWREPNVVTAVDTVRNTVTLRYPLTGNISTETLYFRALITYTHGDEINNLTYGGGKFIGWGNNTARAYSTTNMTDWRFTQQARTSSYYGQGGGNGNPIRVLFGALPIDHTYVTSTSEVIPGIVNSLSVGDDFHVSVSNGADINADYYDHYYYGIGYIDITPINGVWQMGNYFPQSNNGTTIYSYNWDNPYWADSVKIETWNHTFSFQNNGFLHADYIATGEFNNNDDVSHIEEWQFDDNYLYGANGTDLFIDANTNGSDGGLTLQWAYTNKVIIDTNGVTVDANGYDWVFNTNQLTTPYSSYVNLNGFWTLGNENSGYPTISATNNIDLDAYDLKLQSNSNYWYFNRDGSLELPYGGPINVQGFWKLGQYTCAYIAATDNVVNNDPYDIVIKTGTGSTNTYWYFNRTGTLQLPVNGDIVDSNGYSIFKGMVQNLQNTGNDYTLQLSDRSGHIYKIDTSGNVLIPTNDSVTFPIGSVITLVTGNYGTRIMPVNSGTTTVILSKFGSDANIEVPADTYVTILKTETDKWIVQIA